jgi:hypothetical protein
MDNILRFETNVPVGPIALKFDEGKPVEGRFGDQYLYTLMDGRTMYVSPVVASKINEQEIRRGDQFTICKKEVKDPNGGKPRIEWQVYRNQPAPAKSPTPAELTGIDETDIEKQLRESLRVIEMRKAQQSQPGQPAAAPSAESNHVERFNGNGSANGNHHEAPRPPATATPTIPLKIPMNIAFREILAFCKQELTAASGQWADGARQDLVSTLIIGAMREGWVGPWERGAK